MTMEPIRRNSGKGRPAAWLFGAALALAVLGIAVWSQRKLATPSARPSTGTWTLERGTLQAATGRRWTALRELEPGRYRALEQSYVTRGGVAWTLPPSVLVDLPARDEFATVLLGTAYAEVSGSFDLYGQHYEAIGLARISVDSTYARVVSGSLRSGLDEYGVGQIIPRGGDAVAAEEPPSVPAGHLPAPARVPGGRVVDAATGAPIAGAHILVRYYRDQPGAGDAEEGSEEESDAEDGADPGGAATDPVRAQEETETAADGSFDLRIESPEDPRLCAWIQVDVGGYPLSTQVLSGREDCSGAFTPRDIPLRRSATARMELRDADGRPLSGVPVKVTPRAAGCSFLEGDAPELSVDGRVVRRETPLLLVTDEEGGVRVAASEHDHDVEVLDPRWYLFERILDRHGAATERVRVLRRAPIAGSVQGLTAFPRWMEEHTLIDLNGEPVAGSEIVVRLKGMPPQRLMTDDHGRFTVGILPTMRPDEPLGFTHPRRGTVEVLTPAFFRVSSPAEFPSTRDNVVLNARPAGILRLRCADEAGEAIAPGGFGVSHDLTLESWSAAGEVVLRGPVPPAGSTVEVFLSGYLPAACVVPARSRSEELADLGTVVFARGSHRTVRLTGAPAAATRGAVIRVSRDDGTAAAAAAFDGAARWRSEWQHRLRLGDEPDVTVHGLTRGIYRLGVEGPFVRSVTASFRVDEEALDEIVDVPVEASEEEDVVVRGVVRGLDPADAARCEVVESFFVAGVSEPLVFDPYPLAPDGSLGSQRRMAGVLAVQACVIFAGGTAADIALARTSAPPVFEGGELDLRTVPRAEIAFEVEGLGTVLPPLRVTLEGEGGAPAIARLRRARGKLIVENLRAGNYTLRWRDAEGVDEVFGFSVPRGLTHKLEGVARRSAHDEEVVRIQVEDLEGNPVENPESIPRVNEAGPPEPGAAWVKVSPRKETRFSVVAPGFLDAHVNVPPGGNLPKLLHLGRPAAVEAMLLGEDGRPVDGEVSVSWEPLAPDLVTHGADVTAPVDHGRWRARGLPPLPLRFTLRLAGSGLVARREWSLREGTEPFDAGTVRFAQTRRIEGRVLFADGTPASRAMVSLVPRDASRRFPLRERTVASSSHAARADVEAGRFVIDGLPLAPRPDWVLVAHLPGYEDAIEDPLVDVPDGHDFVLYPEGSLTIDVGYADGRAREAYGFWLEHFANPADPESRTELGEVAPGLPGGLYYSGIEPGLYRIRWGLREAYAPLPGHWESASVVPGRNARIQLRVEGQALRGRVRWNAAPLARGWILLTDDPAAGSTTCVGRVRDGEYILLDPPDSLRAYAAVVPEDNPQPVQNITRGEALPQAVRNYRHQVRSGSLDLDFVSHDLTLEFSDDFLARHPGAVISTEYYRWDRGHYEPYDVEEAIDQPVVRFQGLRPGPRRIGIRSAKGGLISSRMLEVRDDVTIRFP